MNRKGLSLYWGFLACSFFSSNSYAASNDLSGTEALQLGTQAYIYAYPLVTMDTTRKVMTNVASPQEMRAPMGQFSNAKKYPTADFKDITTPNADTLYSVAWIDLSKEPYILHLPNENDRYYLMPLISGWTNVFAVPGKRTTGTEVHDFIITGPQWQGKLPALSRLKSPTNLVWILGRTYCTGTPEDYKAVYAIQQGYSLTPLSQYHKPYTPPKGSVDPKIDMKTPVRTQVNNMDAATYFKRFAELLKDNPPAKEDAEMVDKLSRIGIAAGQNFDIASFSPEVAKALENAVKQGQEQIMAHEKEAGQIRNGWIYPAKAGSYGTDYLQRAYIAAKGLGANREKDAIYPSTSYDNTGKKLNGQNNYIIHFNKDGMPPVKGFWSLTMYNPELYFVKNTLNRYNLSQRNEFKANPDGSIDLYIQNKSPGKNKEANWLPAPKTDFTLVFRFYWPDESILNGSWNPPEVIIAK